MQLYVFDHCPYCVRPRIILGAKNIDFNLKFIANDDAQTPIAMVGKKMVPILQKDDQSYMVESLDIVEYVDNLDGKPILGKQSAIREEVRQIIDGILSISNKLVMPRFIDLALPEFIEQSAIDYFVEKKSAYVGDFNQLMVDSKQYIEQMNQLLIEVEKLVISQDGLNGALSYEDILLFPILRNLTCVKGLEYQAKTLAYLNNMAVLAKTDLYFNQAI